MTTSTAEASSVRTHSELESALSLKQLQINRLLNITQAINENVDAEGLFAMYESFLNWEMGVKLMSLYFRQNKEWKCAAAIGLSEEEKARDISNEFARYHSLAKLSNETDPLLSRFSIVIPVSHKEEPLAYVFVGEDEQSPEMYNKVQFVTTITNIIAVAIENKRLFKKQLLQERYQAELEIATDIQRSLVPNTLPKTESYEMSALYIPRFGVGGDFYSAERFDNGKLLFCVADIAGKGTGAALLMSNFEASFWTLARSYDSMELFVRELNSALFRVTRGDRFVTLFVAEYNPDSQLLTYVNAGHNPPLVSCKGTQQCKPVELREGCTFLGAFEELPTFHAGTFDLSDGGLLLCYTDGVTELISENGTMFGEENLEQFASIHGDFSASDFNEKLLQELRLFQGNAEATDDVTVLSVSFSKK